MRLSDRIDGASVASAVRMLRTHYNEPYKSVLILEGSDDKKVFDKLIGEDDCIIEVACGKQNVCDAFEEIDKLNTRFKPKLAGCLGIVDSDYEEFDEIESCKHTDILRTDGHDLEYMLLASKALDILLSDLLDYELNEQTLQFYANFKESFFTLGSKIGYLRLKFHRYRKRNGIGYRSGDYERMTCNYMQSLDKNHRLSWTAALRCINSTTGYSGFTESETSHDEWELLRKNQDKYLCHGKDMLEIILCELLPKMTQDEFGKAVYVRKDKVREKLSDSYDMTLFHCTMLCRGVKAWQDRTGFHVLAD